MGFSASIIIATRVMCSGEPGRQASRIACMHALVASAAAAMFFLAKPLAEITGDWSRVFMLSTGLVACLVLLLQAMKLGTIRHCPPASLGQMSRVARHPILLACIPAVMGYLVIEQSMTMFLPALLADRWLASPGLTGAAGALFWGGIIVGRFGVMPLTRRFSEPQIIAAGGLLMGICCTLVALSPTLSLALPCVVLAGVFGGPVVPLCFAWATRSLKHSATAAITTCQLSACAGGLLGPMLTGTLADNLGLAAALAIAAALVAQGVFPIGMSLLAVNHHNGPVNEGLATE